jgi:hypothetical protein
MLTFKQYIAEQRKVDIINSFVSYACDTLELGTAPEINLVNDKKLAKEHRSFGSYYVGQNKINVNIAERHVADILRTLAHEMVHCKQDRDGRLFDDSGNTGSDIENEANSQAGIMLRNFGRTNPFIFEEVLSQQ